jgi:hypothetical protein
LPSKTFISKEERNASGDLKLKPALVYHSETHRAKKGFSKSNLPVIWKFNGKVWLTMDLFNDWFVNNFCTVVQHYCQQKNLESKGILLLDHAPSNSQNLGALKTCIPAEVVFLPTNTTSIIQPMDHGVIAAFKAYYIQCTFSQSIDTVDNQQVSIKEFWKVTT